MVLRFDVIGRRDLHEPVTKRWAFRFESDGDIGQERAFGHACKRCGSEQESVSASGP